jgi:hypothetical protein
MVLAVLFLAPSASAPDYNVDRSFQVSVSTYGTNYSYSLQGMVSIPVGNYTIVDRGPSPFTAVDLLLTGNGTSYLVNYPLTDDIAGNGRFIIQATATTLTFNAVGGTSPADLVFSDQPSLNNYNQYVIGADSVPGFEAAYTLPGGGYTPLTLPTVFGVVPEPSALALVLLGGCMLLILRRWPNGYGLALPARGRLTPCPSVVRQTLGVTGTRRDRTGMRW